jgi:hypothetical protein
LVWFLKERFMSAFAHLHRLSLDKDAIKRVIVLLTDAGRFRDANPQVAIFLCRAALEELCRAVEARRYSRGGVSFFDSQKERFEWIIEDCRKSGRSAEEQVWRRFRAQNGEWNRVTHSQVSATPDSVIEQLRFWHSASWELSCIHDPSLRGPTPIYSPPRGIQGELEFYRSGSYDAVLKVRLQEETRLRKDAESRYADTEGKLKDAQQRAEEARAAMTRLERQAASSDSTALQAQLGQKAEEVRALEAERAELARVCESLQGEALRSEALREQFALELERLRGAEQSKDEQLAQMRAELDRLKQLELEKAESEQNARENAQATEQELAAARGENEALRKRQESSPYSAQLQELLRQSERRVVDLAEKERALYEEVERYRQERNEAVGRAEGVEAQVLQLRDEIACEAEARQQLERAEARRRRYEDEYPGIEYAHEFFQSAIDGDEEGALPPLSGLGSFFDLGFDRYARRLEASYASGLCTLRVISPRPGVGDSERCRAWEVEEWNLSLMEQLRGQLGIARLVVSGVERKPGFSVFNRESAPPLLEFGASGRTLRLATALRFGAALAAELSARAQVRMSVSWPDLHAIGVLHGTPRLFEPTAPHFGDLGPPEDLEKTAGHCVELSRDELEAGWAYVVAHATLRLIGVLPSGSIAPAHVEGLDRHWLRIHLEEMRRACDEPIAQSALDALAASLISVMQERGSKQPCLEDLLKAMRDPLRAR